LDAEEHSINELTGDGQVEGEPSGLGPVTVDGAEDPATTDGKPVSVSQAKKNKSRIEKRQKRERMTKIELLHCDIIGDEFWDRRPWILADEN